MKITPLLLFLFTLLISCEEVNLKTEGEKIAEQVNTEITRWNINSARVYVWDGTNTIFAGETVKPNFKIEGSFFVTNLSNLPVYYNFNKLDRFQIDQSSSAIYLYFTR